MIFSRRLYLSPHLHSVFVHPWNFIKLFCGNLMFEKSFQFFESCSKNSCYFQIRILKCCIKRKGVILVKCFHQNLRKNEKLCGLPFVKIIFISIQIFEFVKTPRCQIFHLSWSWVQKFGKIMWHGLLCFGVFVGGEFKFQKIRVFPLRTPENTPICR